jgi:hypothetical protein
VHGEPDAQKKLMHKLKAQFQAPVSIARYGQKIDID